MAPWSPLPKKGGPKPCLEIIRFPNARWRSSRASNFNDLNSSLATTFAEHGQLSRVDH